MDGPNDQHVVDLTKYKDLISIDDTQTVEACGVLIELLGKFKPEEIALSFNGGKDCTVGLHLLRVAC